jgi:AcrR family transcriptional regulator
MRRPRSCEGEESPLCAEAIDCAGRLFLRWGYSGTSISMIAEELKVTKAALYYHFPDKEALFLAVFDEYLEGISAELAEAERLFDSAAPSPSVGPRRAFESLAKVFLSRGERSVGMNELAFRESPQLSEKGRKELGERYHRDLVRPIEACFEKAAEAGWLRACEAGEPPRVWLFMGQLSAFFSPGHDAAKGAVNSGLRGKAKLERGLEDSTRAFASLLLDGVAKR